MFAMREFRVRSFRLRAPIVVGRLRSENLWKALNNNRFRNSLPSRASASPHAFRAVDPARR
jgi:hypothetical protein